MEKTYHVTLYRAMSKDEYRTLIEKGLFATWRRKWKFFTTSLEYLCIVIDELTYGYCPDIKYSVQVRFDFILNKPLEECEGVRIFKERGYVNVAMSRKAFQYIITYIATRLEREYVLKHCPKPVLVYVSKRGRICKIYSRKKAIKILQQGLKQNKIIELNL